LRTIIFKKEDINYFLMDLSKIFGKPNEETGRTDFLVTNNQLRNIIHQSSWGTGLKIGGPTGKQIVTIDGDIVGYIGGPTGKEIFDENRINTGYFIKGSSGNIICYSSERDQRNK